jgi:suppressor for copper-sensitivity B
MNLMISTINAAAARRFLLKFFLVLLVGSTVNAQELSLPDSLGDLRSEIADNDDPVTFTGNFKIKTDTRLGVLNLRAEIADQWHVYSVTQKKGGVAPIRSTIKVTESEQFEVIGPFKPDSPPHVTDEVEGFDVPVEEHEGEVVWSAPIQLAEGVDPESLTIQVIFNGQTCSVSATGEPGSCQLLSRVKVQSKFAGNDDTLQVSEPKPKAKLEKFRPRKSHVQFSGVIERADATRAAIQPGDKLTLKVTAEPEGDYHIYAYERIKSGEAQSTLVVFEEDNGWKVMKPRISPPPKKNEELDYSYHHAPVEFSFDINVPADAETKNYTLNGLIGFQTCTDQTCDPPDGVKFSVVIPIGSATPPIPVSFTGGTSYGAVNKAAKARIENEIESPSGSGKAADLKGRLDTPEELAEMAALYDPDLKINYLTLSDLESSTAGSGVKTVIRRQKTTFWTAFFGAFVGGMLLNLMPCVFPVLGLKVMGFVEQAGSDPKKIRMHGIAFTLGLVFSMWILAGIILILKFSFGQSVNWGAQMGNPYFVAAIIVLLFLLGLNMAGVFEIGTSMTRVGGGVQKKKGYTSSFLSGILTTLIATPCSGPFLGAAMGYTLAQPALMAMFLFTIFALGIAFPYVLLSFFPALINRLPRPGAWMHTFKVTMAFALFATVAFFMQAFGGQTGADGLAWLAMALVVLGLAAFFYGTWSMPHVKPFKRRVFGFALPILIAALGGWMCFDAASQRSDVPLAHRAGGLDWQAWTPGKVEYLLQKKQQIVWVDYTADW